MKEYADIKRSSIDGNCIICKKELLGQDSPWSICYDSEWKHNSWGGDTHKYKALLCQDCAEEILK